MLFSVTLLIFTVVSVSYLSAETPSAIKELAAKAEEAARQEKKNVEGLNEAMSHHSVFQQTEDIMWGAKTKESQGRCAINGCSTFQTETPEKAKRSPLMDAQKPLIFVSSAMPLESLKRLAYQAKQTGAILVIRGMVNGSMQATAKLVDDIEFPLEIDPKLFARFNVTRVPVFAVPKETTWHTIAGNVDLNFAMETASTQPTDQKMKDAP